jgi:YVTN family beta-propeller protein
MAMKTRDAISGVALALILVGAGLLLTVPATAQSAPRESLLALSKRDHTLAIIDPVSLKVLGKMPVGNDPHEVIASSDGLTAYVSNYGFGQFNTLAVLDLVGQKPLPAIDLGPLRGPHGLAFVGGKVWFTAEAAKAIGRYDPASGKVDWVLGTGQDRTHMVYVAADLSWMMTTNVNSGTVTLIEKSTRRGPGGPPPPGMGNGPGGPPRMPPPANPAGDWTETVIPVGNGSEGFDVSPNMREIWVANAQDGTVSVIDRAARKVTQTIDANMRGANRLKFTVDGKRALISSLGGPEVAVLDVASRTVVKRIMIGHGAAGIEMQPDGTRAFVACSPDNYVAVIDLKTLEIVGRVDVGPEPDGLAWAVRR